ncbi:MAG: MetQ/NlpA family ABC transporter substrate-binding protein [Sporolactobacillus sp.]
MKKTILVPLLAALVLLLTACGNGGSGSSAKETTLTVGASAVPHAEILKAAAPLLKKKGINLKVRVFQDYVLPNKALTAKQLDANYFQHIPYLDLYNQQHHTDLVNAGKIHIEPFGIYSKKYKSFGQIKDGSTIQISNNKAEEGRILLLLQTKGLVKIHKGVKGVAATLNQKNGEYTDFDNRKHLKFLSPIDPAILPKTYLNNTADLFAINTNFALQANLTPKKNALILEGAESPYANIIAVRKGDQNRKAIKELVAVLHSKKIQNYITKKYKGAVLPVNDSAK